jgi:Zn ribbon nucleic-acid-binding protein
MTDELPAVWRDYRTRQRVAVGVLLSYLPLVRWLGAALDGLARDGRPHLILASAWLTASVAAVAWFASFRCPFCAKHFHWTWWVSNPFSPRCLHCGFRRWRDPEAARIYTRR